MSKETLCEGLFDALVRIRAPKLFGNDRIHTIVFKGNLVYAFDVFGIAEVCVLDPFFSAGFAQRHLTSPPFCSYFNTVSNDVSFDDF